MEPKPTLKDIKELLASIRASTRAEAAVDAKSKLVKKFENVSLITTIKNPLGCKAFLDAYIVSLVKQYLHDECAQEILFVAYGLLEDFTIATEKEIDKRRIEYASRAINNTYIVSKEWKNPHKSLYKKEEEFITAISTEIEYSIKNKGNDDWHLNLGGGVARKLVEDFSDEIPEQYPLPKPKFIPNYVPQHAELVSTKPRSFSHTVTKDQDTQKELDDSTEAISDNGQKEAAACVKDPESPQSSKSETLSGELRSDATEKPPQPLPQDLEEKSTKRGNGHEDESTGKTSHIEHKFDRFYIAIIATLTAISVIAVTAFTIALVEITQHDGAPREVASYPITIPYLTPAQQSCSLPVERIVANNDGPIRLYPGAYTCIDVDVNPPEARYSLKYISENQDAVGVSDGRVYAYENYAPASGALFEEVTIWIKPIKPASPDVETKVAVIVNYSKSMDELKHFTGAEVTSNISEPIS